MALRRLSGLILACAAGWLLWGGIHTVSIIMARGSPLSDALLAPPTSLMRIAGTALALLGGLIAFLRLPFGALISLFGTGLFVLLTASMILSGANSVLWTDEAIYSGLLVVLTGALLVLPRD